MDGKQALEVALAALGRIERWHGEFPSTGRTHEGSGEPVSYGYAHGSNGERDYMRRVAREALAATARKVSRLDLRSVNLVYDGRGGVAMAASGAVEFAEEGPSPSGRYRRRSLEVEAVRYTEEASTRGWGEGIPDWLEGAYDDGVVANVASRGEGGGLRDPRLQVRTGGVLTVALPGDWIVRFPGGEIRACKPDTFDAGYEPLPAAPAAGGAVLKAADASSSPPTEPGVVTPCAVAPEGTPLWVSVADRLAPPGGAPGSVIVGGTEVQAPPSPFPARPELRYKGVGWAAYFAGTPRDRSASIPGQLSSREDYEQGWDAASRWALTLSGRGLDMEVFGSEMPWPPRDPYSDGKRPSGAAANSRREGWTAYFLGRSRDGCPFPPDRRDLLVGYHEGWDAARAFAGPAAEAPPPAGGDITGGARG